MGFNSAFKGLKMPVTSLAAQNGVWNMMAWTCY